MLLKDVAMQLRRKDLRTASLFFFLALGLALSPKSAQAMDCTVSAFQNLHLRDGTIWVNNTPADGKGAPVVITSATIVPAANGVPEYCDVVGTMLPTITFEVALPTTTWNHDLVMSGNGGKAGTLPKGRSSSTGAGSILGALKLGYAATGTDTGHNSAQYPGSTFAYADYPTAGANPDWYKKLVDFAYLSVHETIGVAKEIVTAYYGNGSKFTYWFGCSTGGRQGLMEAQRYPTDFDGISVGSAVNSYMAQQMSAPEDLGPQYVPGCDTRNEFCGGPQLPPANMAYLGGVVYAKCDSIDGVVDGLIDDPRKCQIDVEKDLAHCPQETYSPYTSQPTDCFTSAQRTAIKQIYAGAFNSKGKLVVHGLLPGAEGNRGGWNPWLASAHLKSTMDWRIVGNAFNYLMFDTAQPSYDLFTDWNWDMSPALTANRGKLLDATDPDLSRFFRHGGKLIMYHGWADVISNPAVNSLAYYQDVMRVMPQANTSLALYMIPGMGHCGGGVSGSCNQIDWVTPLVNWVEKRIPPGTLQGATADGSRTRPVCRYPAFEKYKGQGDINDAKNFVCVAEKR
jgi:Tannase and feruloyl esterase